MDRLDEEKSQYDTEFTITLEGVRFADVIKKEWLKSFISGNSDGYR